MGSFFSFLRDVIADVKTSWRFRVAVVLWIPLIVTAGVLVVRFGIRNTLSEKYKEFKTTFIPETTVNYPNIEIYFKNTQFSGSCSQWTGMNTAPAQVLLSPCTDKLPRTDNLACRFLPLSSKTNTQSGNDFWGQPIHCNFTFVGYGQPTDDEMFVLLPGGWAPVNGWNVQNALALRPNNRIGVDLFHELFFAQGIKVDNWFAQHTYETSIFPDGSANYNTSIRFDIPFNALQVNWEEDGFDSWFLMATWGGGFFFFYCLFLLAFNIAKFFLPDDSRLLRSGGDSTSTPLIS